MSLSGEQFIRYSRQLMLPEIGEAGQEKLAQASIVIVGAGGLGCPVAMYLAAAGIGNISIVDGDNVDLSNLARQLLFKPKDIGKAKAMVAARRLQKQNPTINITPVAENADRHTLFALLKDAQLVLDCTDQLASRHEINRAAVATQTRLISAAALAWDGQLLDFPNSAEKNQHEIACLACIFAEQNDNHVPADSCATLGVAGPVLGVLGSMQALRALQALTGNACNTKAEMLRFYGSKASWQSMPIAKNPSCQVCG